MRFRLDQLTRNKTELYSGLRGVGFDYREADNLVLCLDRSFCLPWIPTVPLCQVVIVRGDSPQVLVEVPMSVNIHSYPPPKAMIQFLKGREVNVITDNRFWELGQLEAASSETDFKKNVLKLVGSQDKIRFPRYLESRRR